MMTPGCSGVISRERRCGEMESFHIQIADLVTQVQPLYETTRIYCSNYLTHQPAAFHVRITDEALTFEQYMLDI